MTIAILAVLAAALNLFAVGIAWSHARRVARATSGDARALATALKRVAEESREAELERRAAPGSFEHLLATELRNAPDDAAKIAAVNHLLLDVEHTLHQGATWARAGIRISLAGDFLLGLCAWLATETYRAPLLFLAVGLASALLCLEARRSATRHIALQRADIDALITIVIGRLADRAAPQGERRRGSGRRPSRRRRSS